ncbi:hypothetical protein A0U91_16970 (plasmid) [Acetobacter persici]|uniref:Uncharacterized protein n=2 Tax=Acetobacter persici TaxID=1076596 RepID=A0A1U9LJQ6_9PROT|nr:hypothetical protein A0U91_16970 [Acetobacter persici]
MYDRPEDNVTVTFEGGRSFSVVLSSAYNQGIIGTEINGIVVLDNDNSMVILDRHMQGVPAGLQSKEVERITKLDWKDFSQFCRDNPRYREGAAPDVDRGADSPDMPDLIAQGISRGRYVGPRTPIDLLPEMKRCNDPASEAPYKFPLESREDIIVALGRHSFHDAGGRRDNCLSWNIKVYDFDATGKAGGEEPTDARYDDAWKAYAYQNDVFNMACESALLPYVEKEYTTYPGDDQGGYEFTTAGRSSGHLVLTNWDGNTPSDPASKAIPLSFYDRTDFVEWLKDLPDTSLVKLYKLVTCLDEDLKPERIKSEMDYQFSTIRLGMEEQWKLGEPLPNGVGPIEPELEEESPEPSL